MKRYKYQGDDERVFPTIGVTLSPGDVFESEHEDAATLANEGWFEETTEPMTNKSEEPEEVQESPEPEPQPRRAPRRRE